MKIRANTAPALPVDDATAPGYSEPFALRVFMMDLWCIVPYYTTYLCKSLPQHSVHVVLGSISYHFDPTHFVKSGIRNDPGLLDVVGKLQIGSSILRRGLKFLESCVNMSVLPMRFAIQRPDIIHVQYIPLVEEGLPFELWILKAARHMGIKLVYTVHNELPMDTGLRHTHMFTRVYSLMDALICHTSNAKEALVAKYDVNAKKIFIIPHGPLFHDAPRPSLERARRTVGVSAEETVVLWQGWVKHYKGISFLLDAWKITASRAPKARLVIAGSGDEALLSEIRTQIRELGIDDSVRLDCRFIPPEELPCFYTAADVIVFPYKEITTSGALMTALSYGKPLVTTNLPYFQESVGASGGALLVEYGDEEGFAAALLQLIEDPERRLRMGSNAARVAGMSSNEWDEIAMQTRHCYESVCGKPNAVAAKSGGRRVRRNA